MRGISILAALVVFATHAYGGPLNRLFCPPLCNPHPETPLRSCVHSCGFLRYGKYYDGSRCWYFGRSGKFLRIKGYCKQGLCLRVLTTGYEGSDAQTYCGVDQTKVVLHKATEGKGIHVKGAQDSERTTTGNFSAISTTLSPQLNIKTAVPTGPPHTSLAPPDHSTAPTYVPTISISSSDESTPTHDVAHPKKVTDGDKPKIFNKATNTSSHSETDSAQSMSPESSGVKTTTDTGTQPARENGTYSTNASTSHTQGLDTNSDVHPRPHTMQHSSQPTTGGDFPDKNKIDSTRSVTASAPTLVPSILGMAQKNSHTYVKTSGNRTTMPTEHNVQFGDSSRQPTFLDDSTETHAPKTQALFHPHMPAYVTITGDSGLSSPQLGTTWGTPSPNNETTAANTSTGHLRQTEKNNGGVSTDSAGKATSHGNFLSNFSAAQVGSIIQALRSAGEKWFHRTKAPMPESTAPPEATTTKYPENHHTPNEIPMSVEVTNTPVTSSVTTSETHPPTENQSTPAKITEGHYVVRNASLSAADVPVGKCAILVGFLTILASY